MSIAKRSASALGKLLTVVVLAAAFASGLVGVVYMSLRGDEMKVPEIVGKDLSQSKQELAELGLKVQKRADRYSTEKPNTILEQIPKAGDTVKTGQMILVVISKTNPDAPDEAPATIKKSGGTDEDDTEKIEELISDKPKKATNKTNSNGSAANPVKKKTSTTRDVLSGNSNNSNANSADGNSANSSKTDSNGTSTKDNKNGASNTNKTTIPPTDAKKPNDGGAKPATTKTPVKPAAATTTGGDVRPRKTP
jgi:superfamily II DNA helicase RecQ